MLYLPDVPQYLDAAELWQWMKETRDDDPRLYEELVKIYFKLQKTPNPDPREPADERIGR